MPNNLQKFKLSLYGNNLGANIENLKYLGEAVKQIPNNLNYHLNLASNNLDNNKIQILKKCYGKLK